jgi:hypothetical protein
MHRETVERAVGVLRLLRLGVLKNISSSYGVRALVSFFKLVSFGPQMQPAPLHLVQQPQLQVALARAHLGGGPGVRCLPLTHS